MLREAAAYDVLLNKRHFLHGDLHPQIAARHHERIALADDLVDLQQCFGLLDLGDHARVLVLRADHVLQFNDVPRTAHEAEPDPIHVVL